MVQILMMMKMMKEGNMIQKRNMMRIGVITLMITYRVREITIIEGDMDMTKWKIMNYQIIVLK